MNHLLWDRELDSCRRAFHHATSPQSAPSSSSSFMATSSWSSFLTKVWRLSLQMVPYTFMNDLWPNMMKIYMREACIWLLSGYDHWHCHYHNHRHFILPPKWISQKWWYFCLLFHLISMIFFFVSLSSPISLWQWILNVCKPCETEMWQSRPKRDQDSPWVLLQRRIWIRESARQFFKKSTATVGSVNICTTAAAKTSAHFHRTPSWLPN